MGTTYKGVDRQIQNGEPVNAEVTNRPMSDLRSDISYLKSVVDGLQAGSVTVLRDVQLDAATVVGTPVYIDASGIWRPAAAELVSSPTSSLFEFSARARVAGVVAVKRSAVLGDIAIGGQVELPAAAASLFDGSYTPGLVYLSATPGRMTTTLGTTAVRVGLISGPYAGGVYRLIVNPSPQSRVDAHSHYKVQLVDSPAGLPGCVPPKTGFLWGELEPQGPYPGVVHTVENPDSGLPGWLPASDPVFAGKDIPAGARFGYNIQADPDVLAIWPPMPADVVDVQVDGVSETDDRVIVNVDGIWWMDDTYGRAPWPVNLLCPAIEASLSSESSSTAPFPLWPVRIDMFFTRIATSTTLAGLEELVHTAVGSMSAPEPVSESGTSVEVLPGTNVVYRLLSSGSAAAMTYRLAADDAISTLGRSAGLRFGLLASVAVPQSSSLSSSPSPSTKLSQAISSLAVTVSRLSNVRPGALAPVAVSTQALAWDQLPDPIIVDDGDEYCFWLGSQEITLASGETLFFNLTWSGIAVDVDLRLYVVRFRSALQ